MTDFQDATWLTETQKRKLEAPKTDAYFIAFKDKSTGRIYKGILGDTLDKLLIRHGFLKDQVVSGAWNPATQEFIEHQQVLSVPKKEISIESTVEQSKEPAGLSSIVSKGGMNLGAFGASMGLFSPEKLLASEIKKEQESGLLEDTLKQALSGK